MNFLEESSLISQVKFSLNSFKFSQSWLDRLCLSNQVKIKVSIYSLQLKIVCIYLKKIYIYLLLSVCLLWYDLHMFCKCFLLFANISVEMLDVSICWKSSDVDAVWTNFLVFALLISAISVEGIVAHSKCSVMKQRITNTKKYLDANFKMVMVSIKY